LQVDERLKGKHNSTESGLSKEVIGELATEKIDTFVM
jgi:hypothetical protein